MVMKTFTFLLMYDLLPVAVCELTNTEHEMESTPLRKEVSVCDRVDCKRNQMQVELKCFE